MLFYIETKSNLFFLNALYLGLVSAAPIILPKVESIGRHSLTYSLLSSSFKVISFFEIHWPSKELGSNASQLMSSSLELFKLLLFNVIT